MKKLSVNEAFGIFYGVVFTIIFVITLVTFFTSCSTTIRGGRCSTYPLAEFRQLEADFEESWRCIHPEMDLTDLRFVNTVDVQCQENALEVYCIAEDESRITCPEDKDEFIEVWSDARVRMTIGRYKPFSGVIELSTAPHGIPRTLRETSYGHELVHLYQKKILNQIDITIDRAEDGFGFTHAKLPGPWTRKHDELVNSLKRGETLCSD